MALSLRRVKRSATRRGREGVAESESRSSPWRKAKRVPTADGCASAEPSGRDRPSLGRPGYSLSAWSRRDLVVGQRDLARIAAD